MTTQHRSMTMAMVCAAAVTAQFIGGKATRDALFLTSLDFTALPTMLMVTSACSIVLVAVYARLAPKFSPARLVPAAFVASGVLFVLEWLVRSTAPAATAVIVYLHVSGVGPLLASGVWLSTSERLDPWSAKRGLGQIAAAGTLGGLAGALVAERVTALFGVPAMLPVLAASQFLTAGLVWRLSTREDAVPHAGQVETTPAVSAPLRSGLAVVAETPQLRQLALLVLLGTTGAALMEYLFKVKAAETFGPGDNLLRFFAGYYAATNLIAFVLQASSSRVALERLGLALATSTPSIALLAGSIGSVVAPGFGGLLVARAGESIFRGSWFRAGYELFYTPIPLAEKRAAKSVVDVGFDRLGDAVGGGLVRLAIVFLPSAQSAAILWLAIASAVAAIVAACSLNRWYLRTLEHSLVEMGQGLDDVTGQRADSIRTTLVTRRLSALPGNGVNAKKTVKSLCVDPEVQDILSLRSRNRERVLAVLARPEPLTAALVPHVIPLLAWDAVARDALFALRRVADQMVGALTDALVDPHVDYAVRRRLGRVFSASVSQRAVDALARALDADGFDIRFQCARSLAAILKGNPQLRVDADQIYAVVLRELTAGHPSPADFVRDRAGERLVYVFTLLSLVLPREPLRIAFRGLQSSDPYLRGTALEYLEGILPAPIRRQLWPHVADPGVGRPARRHEEVVAALVRRIPGLH